LETAEAIGVVTAVGIAEEAVAGIVAVVEEIAVRVVAGRLRLAAKSNTKRFR
jgi:hypothetical protein